MERLGPCDSLRFDLICYFQFESVRVCALSNIESKTLQAQSKCKTECVWNFSCIVICNCIGSVVKHVHLMRGVCACGAICCAIRHIHWHDDFIWWIVGSGSIFFFFFLWNSYRCSLQANGWQMEEREWESGETVYTYDDLWARVRGKWFSFGYLLINWNARALGRPRFHCAHIFSYHR